MKHEEYKDMLELAALDALVGEDLRAVQEHLKTCEVCRTELTELRAAAATLMYLPDPVTPPEKLSTHILQVSQTQGKLRTTSIDEKRDDRKAGSVVSESLSPASYSTPPPRSWRQRWAIPGAITAAIIFAVLIVALAVLWKRDRLIKAELASVSSRNTEMQAELDRLSQRNNELQAELARSSKEKGGLPTDVNRLQNRREQAEAPNQREAGTPTPLPTESVARVVELTGTGKAPRAHAHLVYNGRTGVIELSVSDLPPAPAGKAYQLWLTIGGQPVSGGIFATGPSGSATMQGQIAADARNASAFVVTLEDARGAASPTGKKYLSGAGL